MTYKVAPLLKIRLSAELLAAGVAGEGRAGGGVQGRTGGRDGGGGARAGHRGAGGRCGIAYLQMIIIILCSDCAVQSSRGRPHRAQSPRRGEVYPKMVPYLVFTRL